MLSFLCFLAYAHFTIDLPAGSHQCDFFYADDEICFPVDCSHYNCVLSDTEEDLGLGDGHNASSPAELENVVGRTWGTH